MRFLKTLLWILLGLVLAFLLLAAFGKKDFRTSQSTVINAPQPLVFNIVNDLSTWDSWSPWIETDKTTVTTMGDKFIGVGGSYSWEGEELGSGELEITKVETPSYIETQMSFGGQGEANASFSFEPQEGGTQATWAFESHVGFPMNAFMMIIGLEKNIDEKYARGLVLLKEKVESLSSRSSQAAN